MTDVELVVKMPEETYKRIQALVRDEYFEHNIYGYTMRKIAEGVPLPKSHGKIVDVSEMVKTYAFEKKTNALCGDDDAFIEAIKHVPTIIEADKGDKQNDSNHN